MFFFFFFGLKSFVFILNYIFLSSRAYAIDILFFFKLIYLGKLLYSVIV